MYELVKCPDSEHEAVFDHEARQGLLQGAGVFFTPLPKLEACPLLPSRTLLSVILKQNSNR